MTRVSTETSVLARRVGCSRTRAIARFRSGGTDGPGTAAVLSRTLDRFFRQVLRRWTDPATGGEREGHFDDCGFAVLALGSWGRFGLSLHSDVDCLLLHRSPEPQGPIQAMAVAVRALWDAGIQARVAVYSPARAQRLAARDERVLASLLDLRFIAGSRAVVAELEQNLARLPDRHVRRLARLILREDQARAGTRHQDLFAAEPDLKTGQGGLRDLAALGWFTKWACLRATHVQDASHRLLARPDVRAVLAEVSRRAPVLGQARATLQTARLLLDVSGLPRDRFTREVAWILERQRIPAYTPGRFERDLAVARMQVSGLLDALLHAVIRRCESCPRPKGCATDTGADLMNGLVASRQARTVLVPLPPPAMSETGRASPTATRTFLDVLSSPRPRPVLEALLRTGVLHRVVPGFQRTLGVVPGDEVHAFTLDRHLVLVAAEVADILDGVALLPPGTNDAARTGERHRLPLLLAALLHDLGKVGTLAPVPSHASACPPAHPKVGARLARVAVLKMGLPREQADLVAFLCRHHMVLPEASTTLDCESPEVLRRLDAVFSDVETLDLAFLVGLADMRSLGPGVATTFRESLLARAWSAAHRWKGQKDGIAGWEAEVRDRRDRLVARCAGRHGDLDLVRSLPDRLLMAMDPDRLWDLLLRFDEVRHQGPVILVDPMGSDREGFRTDHEVVYLGHDEIGLLSRLSGGLTLQGLSIQEARIFSIRPTGSTASAVPSPPLVLDQFRVTDPGGVIGESEDARRSLARRILASVSDPKVARRVQGRIREALRSRGAGMVAEVDNSSLPDRTVFRVAGPDAPGLLHVLADILFRHGIDVTGAIVTTEAQTARDTFFAEWAASGGKVLDPEVIRKVLRAISQVGRT